MNNTAEELLQDQRPPPDAEVVIAPQCFSASAVMKALASSTEGLTAAEAQRRLQQYGRNRLREARPTPIWRRLLRQFNNPLIYVLCVSAVISFFLRHYVDCGVIIGVVVVNGLVGFVQEGRAERALMAILAMAKTQSQVRRDGVLATADSEELVPGDVVVLQAGDRIPADLRLLEANNFYCDESALTGESLTVEKNIGAVPAAVPLAERSNMAYMGTLATNGSALGLVTHTATRTELGVINTLVQEVALESTPLQQQLARFARRLSVAIVAVALAVMCFGIFVRSYSFASMFQGAIGIAVAAIPEGLPAVVTIALAIGVQRMAKHSALVRQLPAVEVLGSVDVICTDKTGTLTTNTMVARQVALAEDRYSISGEGYSPEGKVSDDTGAHHHHANNAELAMAARIALLCNDASVVHDGRNWQLSGDPTEGALLSFALKSGLDVTTEQAQWSRLDVVPFESERRLMATLHRHADEKLLLIKGAPETVLLHCQQQMTEQGLQSLDTDYWHRQLHRLANDGMRVIALAYKPVGVGAATIEHRDIDSALIMVALVGIADPPRPEVIAAIQRCYQAGIQVKMITGDNPVTAAAVGRELGIRTSAVLTGQQMEALGTTELAAVIEEVNIFARTSPENKLQLVDILQRQGHVVAMTGDGINDSPALKKANIGIAMGKKGTDAAKEVADFILTDDNFATITRAIREGRTVYDNIVKSIAYLLPTSLAEASIIVLAIAFGILLPITPAQILWINMITAVTLALALAFEYGEDNIMQRRPRPPRTGLMSYTLIIRLLLVVMFIAGVIFYLFSRYLAHGASIEYARSMAVNALVFFEAFYLINSRFLFQSSLSRRAWRHSAPTITAIFAVVLLQIGFTYMPVAQSTFEVAAIAPHDWFYLILITGPILLIVEIEKALGRFVSMVKGKVL